MNGKGRGPEKGYNRQAYAANYDTIFRKPQPNPSGETTPMKQNQETTAPVLPWHKEAIEEICLELPGGYNCDPQWVCDMLRSKGAAIIARHDSRQHAETLRLLAAAEHYVPGNAVTADWQTKPLDECRLLDKIRAHLATLSKPAAHNSEGKGTQ